MKSLKRTLCTVLCIILTAASLPFTAFAASNEEIIYNFLKTEMTDMNSAAICGMMAGIYSESSFKPDAIYTEKDGSQSYGICQWNKGRLEALKNFCTKNKLDYQTLDAQLSYLKYELLETSENTGYKLICSVSDNQSGAYKGGY